MKKVNEIVFTKEVYDNNRDKMYERIAEQLKLLMEQEYVCKVYDDDTDIVVIQFEHDEKKEAWGCVHPYWLDPDEADVIESMRNDQPVEED